jgi:hypothetical protein
MFGAENLKTGFGLGAGTAGFFAGVASGFGFVGVVVLGFGLGGIFCTCNTAVPHNSNRQANKSVLKIFNFIFFGTEVFS